jgi:hypothetical protein
MPPLAIHDHSPGGSVLYQPNAVVLSKEPELMPLDDLEIEEPHKKDEENADDDRDKIPMTRPKFL